MTTSWWPFCLMWQIFIWSESDTSSFNFVRPQCNLVWHHWCCSDMLIQNNNRVSTVASQCLTYQKSDVFNIEELLLGDRFKCKLLWMHDACTIYLYYHVDFCERDSRTILPVSVRLAQAHRSDFLWRQYPLVMSPYSCDIHTVLCIHRVNLQCMYEG